MSLPAEDFEVLGELAGLLGVSRASLVRDLLEAARPVWAVLIDAARTMAAANEAQRDAMLRLAEDLGGRVERATEAFDALAAAVRNERPPASNTGVRTL